jgi:hypothetical protein
MSRHVAKCSDRLFRSGSIPSQLAGTVRRQCGTAVTSGRKRALSPAERDSAANERNQQKMQRRRVISQTQREQRRNAIVQRAVSMKSIRKCDRAQSLLVTYLSSTL